MCQWCGDPSCRDGKKCHRALGRNPFTSSGVFKSARRRIERATGRRVQTLPGAFWDGRRPAFLPGVREAVMSGGNLCAICNQPISGEGHADHETPWRTYTEDAARKAMAESGRAWTGQPLPDDFVRVMSSDPRNLQPSHAICNEQKSDSTPGQRAGSDRAARREAERKLSEQRRREQEEKARKRAAAWRASRLDDLRGRNRDPDPDSDSDGDGGILA